LVWRPISVTLQENGILVIHFSINVKDLLKYGKGYPWPKVRSCPQCKGKRLWGHGYVTRYFDGFRDLLWIKRFRCPDCNAVHTCRPLGFLKGIRSAVDIVCSCLLRKITGNQWFKDVVRQNQQYWYRCLRVWSSRGGNVKDPLLLHLQSFLSSRIFPVAEYLAPLRL